MGDSAFFMDDMGNTPLTWGARVLAPLASSLWSAASYGAWGGVADTARDYVRTTAGLPRYGGRTFLPVRPSTMAWRSYRGVRRVPRYGRRYAPRGNPAYYRRRFAALPRAGIYRNLMRSFRSAYGPGNRYRTPWNMAARRVSTMSRNMRRY